MIVIYQDFMNFLYKKLIIFLRNYWTYGRKKYIKVIYKSSNFLVIDKPYDLKINSNNKNDVTVHTLLKNKYPLISSDKLYHNFYFMHRLDYSTSGVLCIPTNKHACQLASKAMENKTTKKYYLALISGIPSTYLIHINFPIGRDLAVKDMEKMCVPNSCESNQIKNAKTIIAVLEIGLYGNYPATKVLIRPVTGRRHQIRVHCSHIGHRIVGDFTYSNRKDLEPFRMFLHSLRLIVPNSLEKLDIQTKDCFNESNIFQWKSIIHICHLQEAFNLLDAAC